MAGFVQRPDFEGVKTVGELVIALRRAAAAPPGIVEAALEAAALG